MTTQNPQDHGYQAPVHDSFLRQTFMTSIGAGLSRVEPGQVEIELP